MNNSDFMLARNSGTPLVNLLFDKSLALSILNTYNKVTTLCILTKYLVLPPCIKMCLIIVITHKCVEEENSQRQCILTSLHNQIVSSKTANQHKYNHLRNFSYRENTGN